MIYTFLTNFGEETNLLNDIILPKLVLFHCRPRLFVVVQWVQLGELVVPNALKRGHRPINKCAEVVFQA